MSRRKQANPRALKREGLEDLSLCYESSPEIIMPCSVGICDDDTTPMLGLNGGVGTPTSWRSSDTPDDQSLSLSPTSCATPSDPDTDLTYTIGVTENTPYACQFCDKAFPRLSYLKRHEQIHSDQMPFKCDYCQRLFKHKRSRDRHIKLHTGDRKYRCPHCESAFSRSDHLKIHLKTHDNAKPFQCTVCNRGYNTAAALTSHMQNHKKESQAGHSPFRCLQCSASFTSSRDLQRLFKHKRSRDRHIKLHTGDRKYRCPHCESAFSRSDHLKIHLKTHDNAKPFQCTVCNRGYNTAAALTSHMQNHKKESQAGHSPFRCLQCSASFTSSRDLQHHINTHREDSSSPADKSCQCAFCPQFCPTPNTLKHHLEQVHPVESQGRCSICQETFLSLEALSQHRKLHKEEPEQVNGLNNINFTCSLCNKGEFNNFEELQLHVQSNHINEQLTDPSIVHCPPSRIDQAGNFDCEYCTMKFSSVQSLQQHTLTVHSFTDVLSKCRENVYCFQCNMVFSSVAMLTDHVRTIHETGSVPLKTEPVDHPITNGRKKAKTEHVLYNGASQFNNPNTLLCSQCNAAFPDFESFRNHLKTHLDVIKFSCTECDGEFGSEEQLDNHVITHFLSTSTEYGCQCCLKLFTKPDELQKHLMDIHAHHLYRCALCKEMFDSKVTIQVHFAVKHSNECRLFQCTTCNSVFRTEMEFQLHVKVAHLSKHQPFRCLLCELSFPTELQLQYHLQSHKKQFVCTLCDEAFHVEFLLDRHLQTRHSGETMASTDPQDIDDNVQNLSLKTRTRHDTTSPTSDHRKTIRCELCDNTFPSDSSLSTHRRQVHNVRTQKTGQSAVSLFCAYCNESCKSRTELENHMKSHTVTPSKHKCNICDEICPSATTLAEHKLTHCKVVTGSTCVVCRVVLKSEEQFFAHVQKHNSGLPTPCVVCRQTLMSDVEVQIHARFHLKNCETLYSCCVCTRQFEASNLIITGKHESMHTYMCKDCFHSKTEDLRCSECQVKFESISELEKHKLTHKKTYQCIKCQMSFETEGEIQLHVATHVLQEGTNHECNLCHKVFDSPAKLQCHLIEHTFEGCSSYACYICSSVFTTPHLIQSHMLDHGLNSRPYDCSQCHQRFFFRAELEHHGIAHSHCNQLQCPECNKVFANFVNLNNHRKIHEQKGGTLKCSLCPEVFYTSADMQQHHFRCHSDTDLHEGKKYFPCTECEKVFPCMSNLQGHMRIHTQGTKFICPQCNKEFALSRNLNIHMRSHSGEKPYECPICKKRFARKENRKAHLKSHTGLKPFMCPHCGKTFSRKCHVKEHMRIHITSTTHPCEMCSETFSSTRQLRRHMVNAHQKHYDHVCTVCGDVFEHAKSLDHHLQKAHQVLTTCVEDNSLEEMSESSPGQSSSSGDLKDLESSECSSMLEEGAESPVSVTDDSVVPPAEAMHTYMCKDCFHSKTEDLRCSECQVKFESISELEKHKLTHKKTYQCIKCQMSFETEGEIQLHVATHVLQEGTNHECNLCHKVFDSPAKLQCHLIEHTFEGCSSYACYICSSVFTTPHLIQSHMLDHGLNSRPYDCSQCHQRFFFRAELEHHGIAHSHCNQLQCPECNKVFANFVNLNNHRKIHEQKGGTLKCSLCPEVFYTSADMQQHHFRCHSDTDLHEGKKYFPCTECEKVFPCMSNLQGHMRIHTQGTKFICPQCNKEFALSRNLNIHMRSHSGEKPYECPICKKRFARKENRKAHLKSHTGLKPFMCPHCGKTFSRKCHVKEHMRIHITSTTHPCEMCSETFSSTRQLRRHMVNAHQKHYDHVCTVCGDVFEHAKSLDHHLQKAHQVLTTCVEDNSLEEMSESSPGQSSSSGDLKDLESSECSSMLEEGAESPVSVTDDSVVPPAEASS
ncbi:zinc finger protein 423-like [Centruroides sculpturatus]|uniref:zinc finger protein 423-like n=1 Tax=Centruroides sculpturatus TaxID=218467 RepID=UPI000C6D89D3|nr:zinc finger protein 423-like [Centruroides sculpturatus]